MDVNANPRNSASFAPKMSATDTYTITSSAITRASLGLSADPLDSFPEPFWDNFTSATAGGWSILLKQTLRMKKQSAQPSIKLKLKTGNSNNKNNSDAEKRESFSSDSSTDTLYSSEGAVEPNSERRASKIQLVPPTPLFRIQVNAVRKQCQIFRIKKSEIAGHQPKESLVGVISRHDSVGFGFTVTEFTPDGDRSIVFGENGIEFTKNDFLAESNWNVGLSARKSNGEPVYGVNARLYFWTPAGHAGKKKEPVAGASVLACDLQFDTKRKDSVVSEELLLAAMSGYVMLGVEESARKDILKKNHDKMNSNTFCGGIFRCFFA